jgi:hypothetical protein
MTNKTQTEKIKSYTIRINDNGQVLINNILINEEIFNQEEISYKVVEREQQIEDLIMWISESKSESDKYLMKEDLKMLMGLNDELIFSSIQTNEFIVKSQDRKEFNNLCKEILKLNGQRGKD